MEQNEYGCHELDVDDSPPSALGYPLASRILGMEDIALYESDYI